MPVIEQIIYSKSILNRMMLYNSMLIPMDKPDKTEEPTGNNGYPTEFHSISKNNKISNNTSLSKKEYYSEKDLRKMAAESGIKLD